MTVDPAMANTSEPKPMTLDTGSLPLGERALRLILDHVLAVGDEAETTYLEVKSSLDLGSKTGVAKVAKFLLGAANRRPKEAERHFRGYAVLVIGVQKDTAPGIPRGVEAHELEDRLRPYLGPQFPAFEFGRIGVDDDREVLFIVAQPPQDGQPIFPCHKSFQGEDRRDSLEDGAVYVRGTSNTRQARSGEVQALVERARGGKPPIDLEVEILGSIGRVSRVDEVLERLYQHAEEQFKATPEPVRSTSLLTITLPDFFGSPEPRSAEERAARLVSWRKEKSTNIAEGREHFLGVALPGAGIRVVSRGRFVAKPHLIVTFLDCEALEFREADDADFEKVVEPIVRQPSRYVLGPDLSDYRITPRDYPVSWTNQGHDVEVTITPESFRPNAPWTSDQDDYVLLARDPEATSVTVTWVLTEEGNDEVTRGVLEAHAADLVDAADLFNSTFLEGN
ncbi:hypothetical protein [Arthrobacter sp. FW306-2-2C-D06B]|uniref:hypothetical protein n=1 Tax=Arthrobacter sp. FW306-2-2C-D06B TaxID=2879618 RepID=UPI001F3BDB28|nr:hypothetical protein [Arthrobacter sp. FW306-2-2C-D06B]UKA56949.1 hypothetical protein LFT47_11515 [Arthrobacter sp. FW306-2-2C-D06B]